MKNFGCIEFMTCVGVQRSFRNYFFRSYIKRKSAIAMFNYKKYKIHVFDQMIKPVSFNMPNLAKYSKTTF